MIKVWLGSLSAYNTGALVGQWVDLPKESEELDEIISAINEEAEQIDGVLFAEEVDIFDFETEVDGLYDELDRMNLRQLNEVAERLEGKQEYELNEIVALAEVTDSLEEALTIHEEGAAIILHDIEDNDDLGHAYAHDLGAINIPDEIEAYINYESIGRDLCCGGWNITSNDIAVCLDK